MRSVYNVSRRRTYDVDDIVERRDTQHEADHDDSREWGFPRPTPEWPLMTVSDVDDMPKGGDTADEANDDDWREWGLPRPTPGRPANASDHLIDERKSVASGPRTSEGP